MEASLYKILKKPAWGKITFSSYLAEYTYLHNSTTIREPVYIDFDIDAELFVIDDVMELQISKISDIISKCINGDGKNKDITATPLPINHGN